MAGYAKRHFEGKGQRDAAMGTMMPEGRLKRLHEFARLAYLTAYLYAKAPAWSAAFAKADAHLRAQQAEAS